jgi:hypothetical protein
LVERPWFRRGKERRELAFRPERQRDAHDGLEADLTASLEALERGQGHAGGFGQIGLAHAAGKTKLAGSLAHEPAEFGRRRERSVHIWDLKAGTCLMTPYLVSYRKTQERPLSGQG